MTLRRFQAARVAAASLALGLTLLGTGTASAAPLPTTIGGGSAWTTWIATTRAELDGYWKPIMGARYRSASLALLSPKSVQTACGKYDASDRAFFCPLEDRLYVDPGYLSLADRRDGKGAQQAVIAHEWGHHIQLLQGLPDMGMQTELQADCLAGAALSSISIAERLPVDSFANAVGNHAVAIGDASALDRDHGTSYERISAVLDGWRDLANCNLTGDGSYYPTNAYA